MTPEVEKQIFELFRESFREMTNPILDSLKEMTDEPAGQAEALKNMAWACSHETNRLAMRRLCEKMEDLIDERISGSLTGALGEDINRLSTKLDALRKAANEYANFLEPYGGFGGTVRLAMETGLQPWNLLAGFVGKHPFQIRRSELSRPFDSALEEFFDAFLALILAFESAVSNQTGKHFSFREAAGYPATEKESHPRV